MAPIMSRLLLLATLALSVVAKDTFLKECPTKTVYEYHTPTEGLDPWTGNDNWFYYGCFQDVHDRRYANGTADLTGFKNGTRAVNGPGYDLTISNSPDNCARLCQAHSTGKEKEAGVMDFGFSFAAVQNSTECYCPRFEPARTEKLDDSECNFRCTDQGKRDFACGGARARSVYRVFTGKRGVELYEGQKKQRGVKSGADVVRVGSIVTLSAVAGAMAYFG